MNFAKIVLLWLFLIPITFSGNKINYLEPCPRAEYVSIDNNIIIGFEKQIELTEANLLNSISVNGSASGFHSGTVILCSDKKKIIFKPSSPFDNGEKINVALKGKLIQILNPEKEEYEYWFNTSSRRISSNHPKLTSYEFGFVSSVFENNRLIYPPPLIVTINNDPAAGFLFTTPFNGYSSLVISNSNGTTYWYGTRFAFCGDFKKQPNGNLTYYDNLLFKHFEMNLNYNIVDSFYCGNGYEADIHELRVLNNHHALLMAYDPQTVDMSHIVQGGDPNATVIGLIIQEIDENKNVVFQWRSWDHFAITDALHENLLDSVIDYVHGNSIDVDTDGNLLISSRHLDEITKIDRTTGDIIWRFGGLHNQFTFTNDTLKFTYQHAARRISNGNITIFDNGNWHTPHFSRAVEYLLNETNMTATLVWQYRKTPDVYGFWGGYVQRLDNGNTLISWGGTRPTVTEVKPDGTIAYEASYQQNIYTYRAYKFNWLGGPTAISNQSNLVPKEFYLNQNYPNPFNPMTVITYDLPKTAYVELSIFDVTGREVKKLVSEIQQPGSYEVTFGGSQYSSGLYFYRLQAADFTVTRKMILVK
jgi:hypothetical protein